MTESRVSPRPILLWVSALWILILLPESFILICSLPFSDHIRHTQSLDSQILPLAHGIPKDVVLRYCTVSPYIQTFKFQTFKDANMCSHV